MVSQADSAAAPGCAPVRRPRFWSRLALRVVLPSLVGIALFSAAVFVVILPAVERSLMGHKKQTIRELTHATVSMLERYERRVQSGEMTRPDAKARALAHIRNLRYGDELRDYFWVHDTRPRMLMHPYRPELEGQDLADYQDQVGAYPFREMTALARAQGEGYVDYHWQWKDDPTRVEAKVSYVQQFAPWGWVVGTGMYVDDVLAETRTITRQMAAAAGVALLVVALLSGFVTWQSYQIDRHRYAAERQSRLLSSAIEQSVAGIALADVEGRLLFVNAALARMHGRSREELIGAHVSILHAPAQVADVEAVLTQVFETGTFEGELDHQRRDGTTFPAAMHVSLVRDASGQPVAIVGSARDITEARRAAAALREAHDRRRELERIINHGPAMALLCRNTDDWPVEYVSDSVRQFGYTPEDLLSGATSYAAIVHPDDRARVHTEVEQHIRDGTHEFVQEYRILTPEGDVRWVDDRTWTRCDAQGRVTHFQGIIIDITVRKQAEQALRESERSLATLMSNLPGMVYRCRNDEAWTFEFVSEGCREVTGYAPAALIENREISYAALIHEEDRVEIWRLVQVAIARREPYVLSYRIRHASGCIRWLWEQGRGVFDGARLVALEGFVTDVTEQRAADEERKLLQDELHQAQKMEAVGQLAAGVAHDFNNLLTVILAGVDNLRKLVPGDTIAMQSLDAIEQASEQATGVTKSLLTFSHKLPTQKRPQHLCQAVERGTRLLQRLMPASIRVEIACHCDPPLWVDADGTQLQQVLINLAVNARDAMSDGGLLRVEIRPATAAECGRLGAAADLTHGAAVIRVCDTGTGMPPAVSARIFEPFFTTKTRGQGTGLGLAIVHGIIQEHGGDVHVESDLGAGTTFTITLPCVAEPGVPHAPATVECVPAGHGELVVLGEDHQQTRELMTTRLQTLGYRVESVGDGASVMTCHRACGPQVRLYVLDVDMPGQTGLACLQQIRDEGDRTPVLIITGSSSPAVDTVADGCTTVLRKPFTMVEFGKHVGSLIAGGTAREALT